MNFGSKTTYTYKIETELSKAVIIELFESLHRRANHDVGWRSIFKYPDYSIMDFFENEIVIKNFNSSQSGKGTVYNVCITLSEKQASRAVLNVNFNNIKGDVTPIYGIVLFGAGIIIMSLALKFMLKFNNINVAIFFMCMTAFAFALYRANSKIEPESPKNCVKIILRDIDIKEEILVIKHSSK